MVLVFDPNKPDPKLSKWATYVPLRRPEWKTYKRLNDARNAINVCFPRGSGIIYEFNMNTMQWEEIARYEPPELCWHCKTTGKWRKSWGSTEYLTRDDYVDYQKSLYPQYNWTPQVCWHPIGTRNFIPKYTSPLVCDLCYDTHWDYKAKYKLPEPRMEP